MTTQGEFAPFLCRTHDYISMVVRARTSQDAPVSARPIMITSSCSTTREISISGGGESSLLTGRYLIATTLIHT
ncbi:MAG: hypothetical protein ACSLEN_13110 [Candidatus Malihini olakiniferum]